MTCSWSTVADGSGTGVPPAAARWGSGASSTRPVRRPTGRGRSRGPRSATRLVKLGCSWSRKGGYWPASATPTADGRSLGPTLRPMVPGVLLPELVPLGPDSRRHRGPRGRSLRRDGGPVHHGRRRRGLSASWLDAGRPRAMAAPRHGRVRLGVGVAVERRGAADRGTVPAGGALDPRSRAGGLVRRWMAEAGQPGVRGAGLRSRGERRPAPARGARSGRPGEHRRTSIGRTGAMAADNGRGRLATGGRDRLGLGCAGAWVGLAIRVRRRRHRACPRRPRTGSGALSAPAQPPESVLHPGSTSPVGRRARSRSSRRPQRTTSSGPGGRELTAARRRPTEGSATFVGFFQGSPRQSCPSGSCFSIRGRSPVLCQRSLGPYL